MLSLFITEALASTSASSPGATVPGSTPGLPPVGSEIARQWDALYNFLVGLSVIFFLIIVGAMIFFAIQYRAGVVKKTKYITHHLGLEALWTVIPTILLLVIFGWGWVVYRDMTHAPADAMEIRVVGKKWDWTFQYDDGHLSPRVLYVPVNKPVKLVMTSQDVLHSFFIPNFRVKSDVVPGMFTTVWFEAQVPGRHQVFCTEYCGQAHSQMLASVVVLEEKEWKAWREASDRELAIESIPVIGVGGMKLASAPMAAPERTGTPGAGVAQGELKLEGLALQGEKVTQKYGCVACHSADGSNKIGPSFKGIYGTSVELADGSKISADDSYLRESIEYPQKKLVKGFVGQMPTYKGQISDTEINSVISYIKALR
jgi:cytochrome c oxidase subunit 2